MAEKRLDYWGTGKRKTAIARVRLLPGEGQYTVNRKPLDVYFGRETIRMIVQQALVLTQTQESL